MRDDERYGRRAVRHGEPTWEERYGQFRSDTGYGLIGQDPNLVGERGRQDFWGFDRDQHHHHHQQGPMETIREGWEKVKESFRGKGPKGYARSDERIREDVCEHLLHSHDVDATDVEVSVKEGEVTLSGTVTDRFQKRRAEELADHVSGVRDVANRLRLATSAAAPVIPNGVASRPH